MSGADDLQEKEQIKKETIVKEPMEKETVNKEQIKKEMISIIITTRNEEKNIGQLLESLISQEPPIDVILVDSGSSDATKQIAGTFAQKYGFIKIYDHGGTRGESRNFGVSQAKGSIIAFIDGDCVAEKNWIKEARSSIQKTEIVAGKTINVGFLPFEELSRVELYHRGFDMTYPSCNLAYKKVFFQKIGGFDAWFRTAEDIDLNYRAVEAGARIEYNEQMIVYHKARETFSGFIKQAFWNGYGRKQLTLKHGNLWKNYSLEEMVKKQNSFWGLLRLGVAIAGYFVCMIRRGR